MIQFVQANYQWAFSGIGVFLIGLAWALFSRKKHDSSKTKSEVVVHFHNSNGSQSDSPATPLPVPIRRLSNVTPKSIRETIESAPALQEDQIKKNFAGLFVEWETTLFSAQEKDGSLVQLALSSVENDLQTILCTVNSDEYKELGILQRGARIRVLGKILEANQWLVELDEVELFFHD